MFGKTDQAALLTSGSLVWCNLHKTQNFYTIVNLEIESQIDQKNLVFMHDIMRLFLHALPANIVVSELFDFLLYVWGNIHIFSAQSKKIVLLRLFLMFDLLDDDLILYQVAILNPTGQISVKLAVLEKYVARCWNNFYKEKAWQDFTNF